MSDSVFGMSHINSKKVITMSEQKNTTPTYELDDGPLTDEQINLIRSMNSHLQHLKMGRSLFDMTEEEYAESLRKRGIII